MTTPIQAIARQAADTWLRSQVPAGTEPSGGLYRIADGVADAVLLAVQARIRAEALCDAWKSVLLALIHIASRSEFKGITLEQLHAMKWETRALARTEPGEGRGE